MTDSIRPLRLRTFGGLSLEGIAGPVTGAGQQPRRLAILAVLAMAGTVGITRAKLLGLLWPEVDEERGRQALSQALYALRRDSGGRSLVTGLETIRLDPDVMASDVGEFLEAAAASDLPRAATLYTGAFLDGVYLTDALGFERWVDDARAQLATTAERAFESLAASADATGDYRAAAAWWRRLTEIDALRTRAALGLVAALAANGERGAALRCAEKFAQRVRDEMETEPNPAVAAVVRELRTEMPQELAQETNRLGGRYVLGREIGRGGMAVVFLARDLRHARDVAVKMLHPELAEALGRERLAREILVTAGLRHPHILPLFDSGEADGTLYYVMPFIEGESLRARLSRGESIAVDEASRLCREVADALAYAHARGVIHRDIKPENILLSEGHAVVADFGIARLVSEASAPMMTQVGLSLGTPAYMSPEQCTDTSDVDGRSDVFSLACVMFEMLTGRPPWIATTEKALLAKRLIEPAPLVSTLRPDVPPFLSELLRAALERDPAQRVASAAVFATTLWHTKAAVAVPSGAIAEPPPDARERVLVLPFTNVAKAGDADWLSTGIAETVGADLSKISGLKVIGQDAATRQRVESELDGRAIEASIAAERGRSMGARWVVFGAFQKSGTRIRITPHFIDATNGTALGGEKIDGNMDDIFALQDRIVLGLADALRIQLTCGEVEGIERPETVRLTAYEQYARGYRAFAQFGKESMRRAAEYFRAAIAIDPDYALAHAGLGIIHVPMYLATGRKEVLDEGARLLERAITLDPAVGEAHAWLAFIAFCQGRFDLAVRTAETAVQRDVSSDIAWYMLANAHLVRAATIHDAGSFARAVPPVLRAVSLNPRNAAAQLMLGGLYMMRGQHAHAVPVVDRTLDLEVAGATYAVVGARVFRAILHLAADEISAASELLDAAIAAYTGLDHVYAETMAAYAYCVRGRVAERTGDLHAAAADFVRACEIADANEHRSTMGAHWVKARFGLARVWQRMGRAAAAADAFAEGQDLFTSRARFVWTLYWGGSDAEMLYEKAAALATLDRSADALDALRMAGLAGWADETLMRGDPAFRALRDTSEMRGVIDEAAARVTLPPPIGSGGLS
jgi:eukaryotic-like serine/threonine-protein kinase